MSVSRLRYIAGMSLEVSVQRKDELLIVKGRGEAMLSDLKGFSDLIATLCREENLQRVLVDLLEVRQELTFTEHIQLGLYVASKLGSLTRMATVVPEDLRSGNSERAAQKTGMRLRTFTDLDEARAWLREPV